MGMAVVACTTPLWGILTFWYLDNARPAVGVMNKGPVPEVWRFFAKLKAASDSLSIGDFNFNSSNDIFSSCRSKSS